MPTAPAITAPSISGQLETQGFAIVPAFLPSTVVDDLTQAIGIALADRAAGSACALRHLARLVPAVGRVAQSDGLRALVEAVLGPPALLVRSLFFDKTPEANWKVAWHQDLTIAVREKIETPGFTAWSVKDGVVHVQPPAELLERMLAVRLHLDDCDLSNGPLQVLPGSHRFGRLNAAQIAEWRRDRQPTACVVPRGGALLLRPLLLHASSAAHTPKHRPVVHLEFAAEALPGRLEWL
jgi:ectoine hydroxylase-related dioxygenase (phytanoyl-CoA dioxygenase family)